MNPGPDYFGEPQRGSGSAPWVILSIAVVLALGLAAYAFMQHLDKKYARADQRPVGGYVQPAQIIGYTANGQPIYDRPPGVPAQPAAGGVAYQPNPIATAPAASASIQQSLPAPKDPEIEALRASLNAAQEKGRETDRKLKSLVEAQNAPAPVQPATAPQPKSSIRFNGQTVGEEAQQVAAAAAAAGGIDGDLPDFLRNALQDPPGGNPQLEAEAEALKVKIRSAPSLGNVMSYDNDWGVVTFDAGAMQQVKKEQRFAVRRGEQILGWIKVDDVTPNQSIAILMSKNRSSDTALKPEPGDDVIEFDLFEISQQFAPTE